MSRRILILTNRLPYPLKDGGALAMDAMLHGLDEQGWEVYLLAMNTTRHYVPPAQLSRLYKTIHRFEAVDVDNRLKYASVIRNYFFSTQPEHADRFFSKAYKARLEQVLKDFNPDIVQMESIYLNIYLEAIRSHSNALVVHRLHNIEYQLWQRLSEETANAWKRRYVKNLARRIREFEQDAWHDADLLLPITSADAQVIRSSGCSTDMHTTPFGIRTATRSATVKEAWNAFHIGAMDWMPNQEGIRWFIDDVCPGIHRAVPGFRFFFAGRNMPDSFRKKLPEYIRCAGEVPDAGAFAADKKILIVPLRSGSGIRVKILEAMSRGKLVISTSVGMQGIEAIPGEHYLQANSREDFIGAVAWCFSNRDRAKQLAAEGQGFVVKYYDHSRIMQELSAALKKAVSEHNRVL